MIPVPPKKLLLQMLGLEIPADKRLGLGELPAEDAVAVAASDGLILVPELPQGRQVAGGLGLGHQVPVGEQAVLARGVQLVFLGNHERERELLGVTFPLVGRPEVGANL